MPDKSVEESLKATRGFFAALRMTINGAVILSAAKNPHLALRETLSAAKNDNEDGSKKLDRLVEAFL